LKLSLKPNLPTLVISIILFITVFLRWISVTEVNGLRDWGILTFLMSILGVGISFITVPKIRSLGTILAGILAVIGVAVFWSRLQGLGAGYGLIIALIASLGLIAAGYLEYRKLEQPGKTNQPTQAGPPATPPQ
jgi:peptidoglycan/LPS O-acetylase OafA/YrhL